MRVIVIMLCIFASCGPAFAAGGCPDAANDLKAFARCMMPAPNIGGTRYIGTMADLDGHHLQLMQSMRNTQLVPPQTVPYSTYSPLAPMLGATAYLSGVYGRNPAFWNYWTLRMAMPMY